MLIVCENITDRKRDEQLQAVIYEISEAAGQASSLDKLLASVHRSVSRLMEAHNLYVALYDPVTDLISFPYFVDEQDRAPAPRRPGRGLTEYILRSGQPLLATPEVFADLCRRGEVVSIGAPSLDWLGVPLTVGEQTIGVLVVQTYAEGARYGEREKDILTFVSRQVALAVERARAQDRLRESEEKHRSLVDNMHEGVLVYRDGRIVFANAAFGRLVGAPVERVIGRALAGFVVPEDRPAIAERIRRREAGEEEPWAYEIRGLSSDGATRIDVSVHIGRVNPAWWN